MAQQGKQITVGSRQGFPHNSIKLVLMADANRDEADSYVYFLNNIAIYNIFK
jgi:hypothetical protein